MTPSVLQTLRACGLDGPTWAAWHTAAKVLSGQPLSRDEHALYEQCTGRTTLPSEPPAEAWFIVGRRGGKTRFVAACGVDALKQRYTLAPGEVAVASLASADRSQSRVMFSYLDSAFTPSATHRALRALAALVTRRTRWALDLSTGAAAEVHTAHFGSIRGRTLCFAGADEVAFWQREDGSNPASEVLHALRPALATLRGPLLVITTPFAKEGVVWDTYQKHFGRDDSRIVVWQAASRVMNPSIPQSVVDDALTLDEVAARREWEAVFSDVEAALVTDAALRACVIPGRTHDLGGHPDVDYLAFVDAATGSGSDSKTLAVAHIEEVEDGRLVTVIDLVREYRPPFNPEDVTRECAGIVRSFQITEVAGDAFAKGWTDAAFARHGVTYDPSPLTRSELYLAFLSLVNSRQVELPDHPRLLQQLAGLQRRPTAGGRESVDHPARAGAHDDLANVVAGASVLAYRAALAPQHRLVMYG